VVFQDLKVARKVLKLSEVLLKGGKLLKLIKFVSVSEIKNRLGFLATGEIFPGAEYEKLSQTHTQEDIECVNRLRRSLWKLLYKHVI